jgi:hypothetical protein
MKMLVTSLILTLSTLTATAQSSMWNLTSVDDSNKNPVGFIYHAYARGTATKANSTSAVASGLRFVCSVKSKEEPKLAIFWNGVLMVHTSQEIQISVDNIFSTSEKWTRDGALIYTSLDKSGNLVNALKKGRLVRFSWTGNDSTRYATAFELKDFNLSAFDNSCKTKP